MIGFTSTKTMRAHIDVYNTTNKDNVYDFFENFLPGHEGAIVILDNHQAHKN